MKTLEEILQELDCKKPFLNEVKIDDDGYRQPFTVKGNKTYSKNDNMKYEIGQRVNISVKALYEGNANLEYTDIHSHYDGKDKFYELYNDNDELCCLDGEECIIGHIVYDDVYDLVNNYGETAVHFMLSEHDLDIAVFTN